MSTATQEPQPQSAPAIPSPASQPTTGLATNGQAATAKAPILIGQRGVELRSLDEMWRFAIILHNSRLAPKGFDSVEAIVIALELGAELGLPPMAAIQNIAVINGRPSLWGDAMLGICQKSHLFDFDAFSETWETVPQEGMTAICRVRRLPNGRVIERQFSRKDAEQAKLTSKGGPHNDYPRRMLQMRARGWALRDAFPDVLKGMLTAEEAEEINPVDVASRPVRPTARRLAEVTARLESDCQATPAPPAPAAPQADEEESDESSVSTPSGGGRPAAPPAAVAEQPGDAAEPGEPYLATLSEIRKATKIRDVQGLLRAAQETRRGPHRAWELAELDLHADARIAEIRESSGGKSQREIG